MHFRQILGRILRRTDAPNQEAFLFMPAEPKLVEYAYRVAQDVPEEAGVVKFEKMSANFKAKDESGVAPSKNGGKACKPEPQFDIGTFTQGSSGFGENSDEISLLTTSYEKMMDIFGRFRQETLELGLSPLK